MPTSMAASVEVDGAVLNRFAKKLAGNEKKYRDRAVKMLRKWLASRSETGSGGLSDEDFMKIWKGLHYCMWMSDKPIVQEELAVNLAELIHRLRSPQAAVSFISAFFLTEAREWYNIDRLRLEKFMMLIRKCTLEMFVFLRREAWDSTLVAATLSSLCDTVIHPTDDATPEGLKLHVADIYLEELRRAGAEQLSEEQVAAFLDPYCVFLSKVKSHALRTYTIKEVFFPIIGAESDRLERRKAEEGEKEEEEEEANLKVNFNALANRLFELASGEGCRGKNRKAIYSLVKTFKNLAQGIQLEVHVVKGLPEKDPIDYQAAMERLSAFESELMLKTGKFKKQKKRKLGTDADGDKSASDEESSEPVKKKKKRLKAQKVAEMNGFHEMGEDENNLSDSAPMKKSKKKLKHEVEEQQETTPKKARKKKKRKAMAKKEAVPAVAVGLAESTKRMNTEDLQTSLLKKEKSSTEDTEEMLYPEVFIDSGDGIPANQLLKKCKKPKKCIETGNAVQKKATRTRTLTKKKKNQKELSTEESLEECVYTVEMAVKPKKPKKKMAKAEHQDMNKEGMDGDFEIFVPNKKYTGPLKDGFQKAMEASLGETTSEKFGKSFARFESGAKVPAAFVRRAMSKSKVINNEPRKCKLSLQDEFSTKRRVSFGLEKNRAQDFAESLLPSPVVPFNPTSTPDKTILKPWHRKELFIKMKKVKRSENT